MPNDEQRQLRSETRSLIVLLVAFGLAGAIALALIMTRETETAGADAPGGGAFAPEDFPKIAWDQPLLAEVADHEDGAGAQQFNLPPPPFSSEDIYPCSQCHADMETDPERRELEDMHEDIVLDHGPPERWCFDCHNPDDRDRLRLASGELVGFDESYRLCGQCHGTIYRDWREGIHGRRRGYWDGPKSYLLCAHCHDPHAPHFQPMEPLPPPVRPGLLRGDLSEDPS
jgi:uncharacterized CHY-type Zn-finger protein